MRSFWYRFLMWWREEEAQCSCDERGPVVIYDANGWKQWCSRCLGMLV
jgi:hypothetical protein